MSEELTMTGTGLKVGDTCFIQAVITEISEKQGQTGPDGNPLKTYRLQTKDAKFYATDLDYIVVDPNSDSAYTVNQLNDIIGKVSGMTAEQFATAFPGYNSIDEVIKSGKSASYIADQYNNYLDNNKIVVGDIVTYNNNYYGVVARYDGSDPSATKYALYDPKNNTYLIAGRSSVARTGKYANIGVQSYYVFDQIDKKIKEKEAEDAEAAAAQAAADAAAAALAEA